MTQTRQPENSCLHSVTLLKDPEASEVPEETGNGSLGSKYVFLATTVSVSLNSLSSSRNIFKVICALKGNNHVHI